MNCILLKFEMLVVSHLEASTFSGCDKKGYNTVFYEIVLEPVIIPFLSPANPDFVPEQFDSGMNGKLEYFPVTRPNPNHSLDFQSQRTQTSS